MIRVLSLAAAGAGADRCVFPTEPRAPLQASVVAGAARPSARRGSIEANHKTGTYLAACLARVVKNNVQLHSMHTSGNYVAGKRYLVLTRDPFVLVDSAYRYHKRGVEAWTKPRQPGNRNHTSQGHAEAFRDYSRLREACAPTLPALEDESYAAALARLPLEAGLVLEALRSLHRDVPYVVASAEACAKVETCASVPLDDVMANYTAAFPVLARALLDLAVPDHAADTRARWLDDRRHAFARLCDPRRRPEPNATVTLNARHRVRASRVGHVASPDDREARPRRLGLVRRIDALYLGGELARANATVQRLATRVRGDAAPSRVEPGR